MYLCTSSCYVYQKSTSGLLQTHKCNIKKEVRNHFFVQEISSPTSIPYIYFVSFIIENQPSVECVELQLPTVLHASDFTNDANANQVCGWVHSVTLSWPGLKLELQVANWFKPQVDIQFETDLGLIFEIILDPAVNIAHIPICAHTNSKLWIVAVILDPDLECHLLTFFRILVVFCHILSTTGE